MTDKEQSVPVIFKGRARVPTPQTSVRAPVNPKKDVSKTLPPLYKIRNFYLPEEVAVHNTADDCWVSFFNQVYDLTKLIAENYSSPLCDPIVLAAGTDITHWFNEQSREPKTFINPKTNVESCYTPTGRYLHIPSSGAISNANSEVARFEIPWWSNTEAY